MITPKAQTLVKDTIKNVMKAVLPLAARHKLGPEQLRILLDELLTDYVDYERIKTGKTRKTNPNSAAKRR